MATAIEYTLIGGLCGVAVAAVASVHSSAPSVASRLKIAASCAGLSEQEATALSKDIGTYMGNTPAMWLTFPKAREIQVDRWGGCRTVADFAPYSVKVQHPSVINYYVRVGSREAINIPGADHAQTFVISMDSLP